MSEPYDVTRPADADRGLLRFCDRTGREWTEPDPGVVHWEGPTACGLCGVVQRCSERGGLHAGEKPGQLCLKPNDAVLGHRGETHGLVAELTRDRGD